MSESKDEGVVVGGGSRVRYLWAWAFPALAAFAALWLLWKTWSSQGPEITISFEQAPGVVAGRTPLLYRGFPCGEVTSVRLSEDLARVEVRVRLKAFAAGLAREGSEFWIEQPVISLQQTAGLEALIQGNSLRARAGKGGPRRQFRGLESPPLDPVEDPALSITLKARDVNYLDRGTPVYRKGVRVGAVAHKAFDSSGEVVLQVNVPEEYAELVRSNSRFWVLPAAAARLRGRTVDLRIPGLDAVVKGGVAFDEFSGPGQPARDGDSFTLFADRTAAQAEGPPIQVFLQDAPEVAAGLTPVEWFGQAAGIVEGVRVEPENGRTELTVRLTAEAASHAREGARFILERAHIGLEGVSGLETLLTGPVLKFVPGTGEPRTAFTGEAGAGRERLAASAEVLRVRLATREGGAIRPGAPIYFRGSLAGRILEARGAPEGSLELVAGIEPTFRSAVTTAARFWKEPAFRVVLASGKLDLEVEGLEALARGGVCFDHFDEKAQAVTEGAQFELFENKELASATSPPVRIRFTDARGLAAGTTELRYLGYPVGVVTHVELARGSATATARFRRGFDFLRAAGSKFQLVKPRLTVEGFTGLETFLSGIYIDCLPGSGPPASDFTGAETALPAVAARETFRIFLEARETIIRPGAPVLFRETPIGNVLAKELSGDGVRLTLGIQPEHKSLIRRNSQFLDASGLEARVGPFPVRLPGQTLLDPLGRIEVTNPKNSGPQASEGSTFPLRRAR
ncbi:MAG: MlaD family protein [Terrimicrobiaceae bacterium]|nr:MlaD family protein [Terrimicrobiaceae bacterium]